MALNPDYIEIGSDIIGAAFEVRNTVGCGMREEYYQAALKWELEQRGYNVEMETPVPVTYKGNKVNSDYKADLVVDGRVIIEVKALGEIVEKQGRQIVTYLRLTNFRLGYLINFGVKDFGMGKLSDTIPYRKGIYRIVNGI
ncbi:MAG: GxxExxY protein [Bacteroidales bacterium]|nr:GxxExxY protein [Bacteroidales bacterium]